MLPSSFYLEILPSSFSGKQYKALALSVDIKYFSVNALGRAPRKCYFAVTKECLNSVSSFVYMIQPDRVFSVFKTILGTL